MEVKLHTSLTSALKGGEWLHSRFGSFTSDISRTEGHVLAKKKSRRELNPSRPVRNRS
jgi:hypothetical protein